MIGNGAQHGRSSQVSGMAKRPEFMESKGIRSTDGGFLPLLMLATLLALATATVLIAVIPMTNHPFAVGQRVTLLERWRVLWELNAAIRQAERQDRVQKAEFDRIGTVSRDP